MKGTHEYLLEKGKIYKDLWQTQQRFYRVTTLEEKTRLITALLQISRIYMKSLKLPIEMTIVERSMINPWQYIPRFDFQYGDWLRKSFENGIIEPWLTYEMPDLTLIVTQVLLKSKTLILPHFNGHKHPNFYNANSKSFGIL